MRPFKPPATKNRGIRAEPDLPVLFARHDRPVLCSVRLQTDGRKKIPRADRQSRSHGQPPAGATSEKHYAENNLNTIEYEQ